MTLYLLPIPVLGELFRLGGVGVGFFFVLSGFVLAWSRKPSESDLTFYRHRFARVYPLVAVTWVAGLVILAFQQNMPAASVIIASILLLQAWVPALPFLEGVNGPSWSLSSEAFFYILLPVLYRLMIKMRARRIWIICIVSLAVAASVALALRLLVGGDAVALFLYMNPAYRIWEFVLGVALALLVRRGRMPRINLAVAGLAVLAAFFGLAILNLLIAGGVGPFARLPFDSLPPDLASLVMSPLCGALIVAAAQSDVTSRRGHLSSRPMVLLGTWSFALYMTHMLLIMAIAPLYPKDLPISGSIVLAVLTVTIAVALSWVAYRFVEHPLERLIRRGRQVRDEPTASNVADPRATEVREE